MNTERAAVVCLNGWAGRREYPCAIVGETPKRYRIRATVTIPLPSRTLAVGEATLVPKAAVRRFEGES